ncbi:hypothetical protein JMJ35_009714 [Cladonia borealis]|uniref:Non-haem dioxygenase N-terminal domain-containing protein n=1 Tax=Cladonia borealis TaxID=184061 RepID=A0AA39V6C5_9LECA|nr:hypothetical protein JMJ35_009714 [Cladonia borealis]
MAPTATSTQVSESEKSIPLISLEPLLTSSPLTISTAQTLLSAFHTSGFIYLTDYSPLIPPSLVDSVFIQSARFFARPQEQKDSLAWTTAAANRGYVRMGREKVSDGMTKEEVAKDREAGGEDLKESFEIGREGEEGHENRWPDRSTKHRVVEPPLKGNERNEGYPPRYSVAYFCNPDFDRWIEALPGTWEGEKGGKKYPGINSGEYLVQRLSSTY